MLKKPILLSKKRRLNPKSITTFLNIYKANTSSANFGLLLRLVKIEYT
jgi:hypothetical protein